MKLPVTLSDNAHGGLGVIYRTDNGELALRPHAVGVDVAAAVGGVARNFATAAPNIEIVTQFIGQNGQLLEAPPEITSVEQAEAIIAEYKAERSERGLPLDWPRERPPPKGCLPVRGETVNGDSAKPE
jgi:hypothetical protein